jgi:hypothetical protein
VPRISPKTIAIWLAGACLLAAGCTTGREPVYAAAELQTAPIETIAVTPIIDVRADAFRDVEVVSHVRRTVENTLSQKGYSLTPARLEHEGERYGASEIGRMTDAQIAAAAPADVRYVMLVNVDRLERDVVREGRTVAIKLSARLLDVRTQRELWRDTAEGDADLIGLLAILTGPAPDYEAAYDATRSLFSTLPDGPRRSAREQAASVLQDSEEVRAPVGGTRPGLER